MIAVWAWIKKYWYWILLPIGILILLARIFRQDKPTTTVVVENKTPTAAADIALHDNMTMAATAKAEAATAAEIKKIEEEHKAVLDKLDDTQRLEYEQLKKKPAQEVTNWLLKVGKGDA